MKLSAEMGVVQYLLVNYSAQVGWHHKYPFLAARRFGSTELLGCSSGFTQDTLRSMEVVLELIVEPPDMDSIHQSIVNLDTERTQATPSLPLRWRSGQSSGLRSAAGHGAHNPKKLHARRDLV